MMTMAKGHGGARDGAGRRSLLTGDQRATIGAELENHWNKGAKDSAVQRGHDAERKRARRNDPSLIDDPIARFDEMYLELRNITLDKRRERDEQAIKYGDGDHRIDELVGDIREFKRITEPDRPSEFRGYRRYPIRRPKGLREPLIKKMIATIAERYHVTATADYVKACWKEYRREIGLMRRGKSTT